MKRALLPFALLAGCLLLPGAAAGQLLLGQYEDEAPLGSWNVLGLPSAASVALGGAQFARAWDPTASLANPALLTGLPRLSASLSASYAGASLYRYSLVNTGVVASSGNPSVGLYDLDGGGVAFRSGPWAAAICAAALESYARPPIAISEGGYSLDFRQTGTLRVLHAGVARRLGAVWSAGIGVNWAAGRLDRSTVEVSSDDLRVVTITDDKAERLRGFYVNAGLTWQPTERLAAAAVLRSPYAKKGRGESLLAYQVPESATDIRIEASAANDYRQPWILGAGLHFRLTTAWSLAADAAYLGWPGYRVTYYGEPLVRRFRGVVRAGAGIEYLAPARMYGRSAVIPFRLGLCLDPQPPTSVRSTYLSLTFGTGLELRRVAVGISGHFGREWGSGRSLKAGRIVLSLRYVFREGP